MTVNVNVSKNQDIARLLRIAGSAQERVILADQNVVVMNLDDYEDLLFQSNKRIQAEITEDLREYSKTGGLDYLGNRVI